MAPEIIDADECAELLRCSVMQVEEAARDGRLPGFKEGRSWLQELPESRDEWEMTSDFLKKDKG